MLVFLEGGVQREHHVQRLDEVLARISIVHRNVNDIAGHLAVLLQAHVEVFARQLDFVEHILYLGRPHLHK